MMKHLIVFSSLFLLSCAPQSNDDLEVNLASSLAILIDTNAVSCKSQITATAANQLPVADINPVHFSIPSIAVNWKGDSAFRIKFIRFMLTHSNFSGGSSLCEIAGDNLSYAWSGVFGSDVPVAPQSASVNICPMKCGSVSIPDKTKDIFGSGRVLVYGTAQNSDGVEESIQAETNFNVEYRGTGF